MKVIFTHDENNLSDFVCIRCQKTHESPSFQEWWFSDEKMSFYDYWSLGLSVKKTFRPPVFPSEKVLAPFLSFPKKSWLPFFLPKKTLSPPLFSLKISPQPPVDSPGPGDCLKACMICHIVVRLGWGDAFVKMFRRFCYTQSQNKHKTLLTHQTLFEQLFCLVSTILLIIYMPNEWRISGQLLIKCMGLAVFDLILHLRLGIQGRLE